MLDAEAGTVRVDLAVTCDGVGVLGKARAVVAPAGLTEGRDQGRGPLRRAAGPVVSPSRTVASSSTSSTSPPASRVLSSSPARLPFGAPGCSTVVRRGPHGSGIAVEAGDAEVLRHPQPEVLGGLEHPEREHVAAGHHGGRARRGVDVEQQPGRLARLGLGVRADLDDGDGAQDVVHAERALAGLGDPGAGEPLGRHRAVAAVEVEREGQRRDAAVTEVAQVPGQVGRGAAVGHDAPARAARRGRRRWRPSGRRGRAGA